LINLFKKVLKKLGLFLFFMVRVVTNNDKRKEVSAELIFLKIDGCFYTV